MRFGDRDGVVDGAGFDDDQLIDPRLDAGKAWAEGVGGAISSKLRQIVSGDVPPEVLGFVMQVKCPMTARAEGPATVVDHIKLVRNRPDVRFEGRIHEQILPSIRRAGGEVAWTDVCVVHANSDRSPAGRAKKSARDLRLLELDLAERPGNALVLFNLGMTLRVDIAASAR